MCHRRGLEAVAGVLCYFVSVSSVIANGDVLVWATGNESRDTPGVAQYLTDSGQFNSVVPLDDNNTLPLGQLVQYDAVVYFANQNETQDPVAIGNVLADYADTGLCLVVLTFSFSGQGSNTLAGRIIDEELSPFIMGGTSLNTWADMSWNDGSSMFTGVSAVRSLYRDNVLLTSDAILRASWDDAVPMVASKANVVGVNFFPDVSAPGLENDYDTLLANVIATCFPSHIFGDGFEALDASP